jgi:hypothetical protein
MKKLTLEMLLAGQVPTDDTAAEQSDVVQPDQVEIKPWLRIVDQAAHKAMVAGMPEEREREQLEEYRATVKRFGFHKHCTKCGEAEMRRLYCDMKLPDGAGKVVNCEHLHVVCSSCKAPNGLELPKDWRGWT